MSTTGAIFGSAETQQAAQAAQKNKTKNELGKDSFLNLLVTQLKNQNPLDPVKDTDFIAQMAQFSSLEQMQNLTKETMSSRAAGLLGRKIEFRHPETEELETGQVSGVKMVDGTARLMVGDIEVEMDRIQQVWE